MPIFLEHRFTKRTVPILATIVLVAGLVVIAYKLGSLHDQLNAVAQAIASVEALLQPLSKE